jgi:hypothetical protein
VEPQSALFICGASTTRNTTANSKFVEFDSFGHQTRQQSLKKILGREQWPVGNLFLEGIGNRIRWAASSRRIIYNNPERFRQYQHLLGSS